jgi:hypothetical protein
LLLQQTPSGCSKPQIALNPMLFLYIPTCHKVIYELAQ